VFTFVSAGETGYYYIRDTQGHGVGVPGHKNADGVNLMIFDASNTSFQQFRVEWNDAGNAFRLWSRAGRPVAVENNRNTTLIQTTNRATNNQLWWRLVNTGSNRRNGYSFGPAPAPAPSAPVVSAGLTFTGLARYNGNYVVATGETTGRGNASYTAIGSLVGGGQTARIANGQVNLMVLEGKNIFAFEGNDTVKFTLIIQRDVALSSKDYVAVGEVEVTFRNGRATGAVTRITEVGR
jgi:hypothetical protein